MVVESSGYCLQILYISLGPMRFAVLLVRVTDTSRPVQSSSFTVTESTDIAAGIPDHGINKQNRQ